MAKKKSKQRGLLGFDELIKKKKDVFSVEIWDQGRKVKHYSSILKRWPQAWAVVTSYVNGSKNVMWFRTKKEALEKMKDVKKPGWSYVGVATTRLRKGKPDEHPITAQKRKLALRAYKTAKGFTLAEARREAASKKKKKKSKKKRGTLGLPFL
jgi:hypothetical protein